MGFLQVSTFLRGVAAPLEGVQVQVFDAQSGEFLQELQTDAQGQTPRAALAAPPREYSLQYGSPKPFGTYNIAAFYEDFAPATAEGVQIFSGELALQTLLLQPVSRIEIPVPTLWGDYPPKIPEAETKTLPFPTGQAVLPQPVVPGVITVHAGRPDDASAENFTVPFTDYVKNVASSEIYATWPREALKANIYAIQSFTMNRVYTEWYRGKGYGFTITNSTAFDQSFTFGRNIFAEISDTVDEIFTTYIARTGAMQPLFAQYCDGRRVRRAGWLSQWGSQELAEQGLTALQILKSYYGSDIELRQAEKVDGVPLSFQGTLTLGSEGEAVRTVQAQLNTISGSYPLIPKLIEDGVYGQRTESAVRAFQQIFGLPQTGEVDFATWYAISNIFVAIAKLA